MSEQRSIKIKHTEIELPADEEKLIEIVVGLLSGPSSTPLGVRLGGAASKSVPAEEQVITEAIRAPAGTATVQERPTVSARRGGGLRRPADEFIDPSRKQLIDDICKPHASDEAFNTAIQRTKAIGARSLIVILLATERVQVNSLAIPEVASVLSRKFRIPTTLNSVGLALVRMAARSESPLVRGTEAPWDRTKTEYWLTEAGVAHVKSLVTAPQT